MRNKTRCFGIVFAMFLLGSCEKIPIHTKESVVVWHWMTDREAAFEELARRYKDLTGTNVRFLLYAPSDNYEQKVRVGAQTGRLPDIFGIMGEPRDVARYIKAGHVEDLTYIMGEGSGAWKSRFYKEALQTASFAEDNPYGVSPGVYGVPLDVATIPMIYNRRIFKEVGLDPDRPPATWDEFLSAGKTLKKKGYVGFVAGWSESWLIFSFITDLAHNVMGEKKVMDTFRGAVPYTDPDWITVLNAFDEMRSAGFCDPSLVSLANKAGEQVFTSERAGMTFNGSWAVHVYSVANPNLDYRPFPPPALNPKNPRVCWGGAGSVFYVNARSKKKDLAVAFLKWMLEDEQAAFLSKETQNIPSVKLKGDHIPLVSKSFAALMENSIHPSRFKVNEHPQVTEMMAKGVQSILIGEKTPLQVAKEIQSLKSNVAKNTNR